MTPQAAGVLLVNAQNQLLLVQHNYGQRRYSFPGGAVEPSEAITDAALRELQEELGVQVALERLVGIYRTVGMNKPERDVFVFLAHPPASLSFQVDPLEIAEVEWFDPHHLPFPLTNEIKAAIQDHLDGRYGSMKTLEREN